MIKIIYFIISARLIPCLINISCVAIYNNISIESIPISPTLKSIFDAIFLFVVFCEVLNILLLIASSIFAKNCFRASNAVHIPNISVLI